MKKMILLNFIIPFVMIYVGYTFKRHPITDMSQHQGYNTPSSRKSQEHWDFAQSIAPDIFLKYGKVSLVFILISMVLFLFLNIKIDISMYIGMALGFVFVIVSFFKVEKQIKMKFPN